MPRARVKPVTDCAIYRLCIKALAGGSGAQLGQGGYKEMNLMRTNRLPWLLSGALGASLALAPALVAQQQGGTTAQQTPTPGQQGDWGQAGPPPDAQNGQIPRAGPPRRIRTRARTRAHPNIPAKLSGPGTVPISQPGAACPSGRARSGLRTAPAACLSAWTEPIQWLQRIPGSSRSSANSAALRPSHFDQGHAAGDPHQ